MTNMIPDYYMTDRRDRLIPFIFISIFYLLTTIMFAVKFTINPTISLIFYATTAIIVAATAITTQLKVSVHGAGIGGLVGFLMGFSIIDPMNQLMVPLVTAIVIAGLVLSSRLYLNVHSPREVHLGTFLGFILSFFGILIFS